MQYIEFASDLPLDRTIACRSVEENEELYRGFGVDLELRQLGKGAFRSDLLVRATEVGEFFLGRFSTAFSVHLAAPAGQMAVLAVRSPSGPVMVNGDAAASDGRLVIPPGADADIVAPALTAAEAVLVDHDRWIETAETISPGSGVAQLTQAAVIHEHILPLSKRRERMFNALVNPDRAVDNELLWNLYMGAHEWFAEHIRSPPSDRLHRRKRIAKQAREYIEEQYHEAVTIEDLCRSAGSSARTLQRSFREYFDLTVGDYLKTVRLNAAYRALRAADPAEYTVGEIARRNGCAHLGRFSVEFRERFGQSPREILTIQPSAFSVRAAGVDAVGAAFRS